ncbi:SDR family NAD(P)-dependent oxidoreductase [Pontibaca methylaminivorans]|uniref:NADP-dependent 3-hydroxy acid dehydrogenase YdfG n=1 Tax=Pontibaca methylaminivorans TaxID=515897 RepID=A0A1R3WUS6_9RHOB|nr:SDR family NAD(P)-dependent oxidoreductase [Pontibaca methylaminivorans]SIT81842.1 NADP-dependent 3-hydroxy acid dehydrogenase YdfG [Pontibaca methylaminivorans]
MTTLTSEGVAVVTGASRGLGQAIALELVARGATVAGLARHADALAETAARASPAGAFHAFTCDVSHPDEVRDSFARIRQLGRIELLINNAAVYPRLDFLEETPESFCETVRINLCGYVNCSHSALQDMVEVGRGRILNVSTFACVDPLPASSAYSVSKGAGRILTRAMVSDLCDRFPGIVINNWMPGALATTMGVKDGTPPEVAARWGVNLALWHDPDISGTTWERDFEILPVRSLRRRLLDTLLLRGAPRPRRLGS